MILPLHRFTGRDIHSGLYGRKRRVEDSFYLDLSYMSHIVEGSTKARPEN